MTITLMCVAGKRDRTRVGAFAPMTWGNMLNGKRRRGDSTWATFKDADKPTISLRQAYGGQV